MGSTCVAAVIRGDMATIAHVGDSRVYLVRGGELHQLTRDHSLVQQLVDEDLIAEDEMETHPKKNVILRSLGVKPGVLVDVRQEPIEPGDIFCLSSDGLTGVVGKEECRWSSSRSTTRPPPRSAWSTWRTRAAGRTT